MSLALHSDPVVRRALPPIGDTLKVLAAIWAVTIGVLAAAVAIGLERYAGLLPLLPIALDTYLAYRLSQRLEGGFERFWRVLGIGLLLVGFTFVGIGLRDLIPPDIVFVLLGLLAPSALFFLTYGMWIRLQASRERAGSLGFFDIVLVVTVGLAYVSFLLTSDVFVGAGQGFGIGVFILVACFVILLFTVMLVGRRRRGGGIGVEVVFAVVLVASIVSVGAIFVWSWFTGEPVLDVPAWILSPTWVLVFTMAAFAGYSEDTDRIAVPEPSSRVRPYWPYLLLALTPPIAIGTLLTSRQEQKVAGVVGLLLVIEVLVVRQLVMIGEQRRARVRQHRLRDLASEEARRTNVILDLALTLAGHDDPREMCDAVTVAVGALVEGAAVAVFGRLEDGSVAAATSGVDDPATMYATLGQLRLRTSRCVSVDGPWSGGDVERPALVAAVMGGTGDRLGYVAVIPSATGGQDRVELAESVAGVADQLALALDREGLLDAVRADTARVRDSVDMLAEGVAVVGPDDTVRACNRAFAAFLGSDVDDLVGAPLPARVLARLPLSVEMPPGQDVWITEMDAGTTSHPRPLRVSVIGSPTDPLEDGVVVVASEADRRGGERERLIGLLDDLVNAPDVSSEMDARAVSVARSLARGLRSEVIPRLHTVRDALEGAEGADLPALAETVGAAGKALRELYTAAAQGVRG